MSRCAAFGPHAEPRIRYRRPVDRAVKDPKQSPWVAAGMLGSVGMTLVVATLLGGMLGYWLDGRLVTTPWLTLIGAILGIVSGFVEMFRIINRYSNTD